MPSKDNSSIKSPESARSSSIPISPTSSISSKKLELEMNPQNIKQPSSHVSSTSSVMFNSNMKVVPKIKSVVGKDVGTLGRGSYGRVYESSGGFAVKEYDRESIISQTLVETSILIYLNHPNIINLIAIQIFPIKIAMPIAVTNLKEYPISFINERQWIFYQVFRAIEYCHNKNIWHRDIKPDNILIFHENDNIIVKLADFGISVIHPRDKLMNEVVTIFWRAPEISLGLDYDETIDEWGIGVTLLEKILGKYVFASDNDIDHIQKIFGILGQPSREDWYEGWKAALDMEIIKPFSRDLVEPKTTISTPPTKGFVSSPTYPISPVSSRIPGSPVSSRIPGSPISSMSPISSTSSKNLPLSGPNFYFDNLETLFSFDDDELEVIRNTVTWPTKRMKCTDILKLPYFNIFREMINTEIPANNIHENYIDSLIKEQIQIIRRDWVNVDNRRGIFEFLYLSLDGILMSRRTMFYTFLLFDIVYQNIHIVKDDLLKYGMACFKISAELWEDDITIPLNTYSKMSNYAVSPKELFDFQNEILKIIDFKTIFPTCEDFVHNYTNKKIDEVKHKRVMYYVFLLILNYDYVTTYTSVQIAQIAIRAADIGIKLDRVPNLYTEDIELYLRDFVPNEEFKIIHQRFFF